jgi:hypothetical protein
LQTLDPDIGNLKLISRHRGAEQQQEQEGNERETPMAAVVSS